MRRSGSCTTCSRQEATKQMCETCKYWGATKPTIVRAPCLYPLPYMLGQLIAEAKMTGCATYTPKETPDAR